MNAPATPIIAIFQPVVLARDARSGTRRRRGRHRMADASPGIVCTVADVSSREATRYARMAVNAQLS